MQEAKTLNILNIRSLIDIKAHVPSHPHLFLIVSIHINRLDCVDYRSFSLRYIPLNRIINNRKEHKKEKGTQQTTFGQNELLLAPHRNCLSPWNFLYSGHD